MSNEPNTAKRDARAFDHSKMWIVTIDGQYVEGTASRTKSRAIGNFLGPSDPRSNWTKLYRPAGYSTAFGRLNFH